MKVARIHRTTPLPELEKGVNSMQYSQDFLKYIHTEFSGCIESLKVLAGNWTLELKVEINLVVQDLCISDRCI